MRELKFRAWDGVNMFYSDSQDSGMQLGCRLGESIVAKFFQRFYGTETLQQYTGLKDKHGVEIYEGDIVVTKKYPYFDNGEPNYIATIEWVLNGFQTVLHCVNKNKRGISDGINDQIEYEKETPFEIIGNIYQNPELLK